MAGENCAVGGEADLIGDAVVRSALAWWLEAGVDVAVQEEPRDWLKPPQQHKAPSSAPPPPAEPVHDSLEAFREWLATSANLPMAGNASKRVLPRGPEQAQLMLLIEAPEDSAAALLPEHWELCVRMLAAIGIRPEDAYVASLSCFHTPGARMTSVDREACANIARRHVALVQPKRLLLFGNGPAQALLGKPLPKARGHAHKIEGVRAVATFHPRDLVKQPSNKSWTWKDLLLLMEDEL